jgi:hypothetical protein
MSAPLRQRKLHYYPMSCESFLPHAGALLHKAIGQIFIAASRGAAYNERLL